MNDTTGSLRALVLRCALALAVALVPLAANVTAQAGAVVELDDAHPDEDDDAQPSSSEIAGPSARSLVWWWMWVPTLK